MTIDGLKRPVTPVWRPIRFAAIVALAVVGCSREPDEKTVARVGDREITRHDFEMAMELYPEYPRGLTGIDAVRAQLDKMIEKKLVAIEGQRRGVTQEGTFRKRLAWVEREAVIAELYREVVKNKVQIGEAELREAFVKRSTSLRVRHIFTKTEEEARKVKEALSSGATFEELAPKYFADTTLARHGGDLGWIRFGDMDEDFEAAAYQLEPGQISEPVKTRWGYHILQVMDKAYNPLLTEYDFATQKSALEKIIRKRKEAELAHQFVKAFMTPKKLKMKGPVFQLLFEKIQATYGDDKKLLPNQPPMLMDQELGTLRQDLKDHLKDVLVEFEGGRWTLGEFLDMLARTPPSERPHPLSRKRLINDIGLFLRDEFLAREGYHRGLEKREAVRREVRHWEEEMIFAKLRQQMTDTLRVSEDELRRFYEQYKARYDEPAQVNIREIFVPTETEAQELYRRVRRGGDFATLARKHSRRHWAAEKGGEFGYFTRGQYGPIGEVAFRMKKDEVSQPFAVAGGYSIVQVIDRKPAREKSFEEVRERVEVDLLAQKREKLYQQWIAALKRQTSIQTNQKLLDELAKTVDTSGRRIDFIAIRQIPF